MAKDELKEVHLNCQTHEFTYINHFGITEHHIFAVHFSFAEPEDMAEIFKKAESWYCNYLTWEDRGIQEQDNSLMNYTMEEQPKKKRGGARPAVYDENGNLLKKGAGRKAKEVTESTGFRIHKESLDICRALDIPLNDEINKFVKRLAKKALKGK